jgi:hypothetical protein
MRTRLLSAAVCILILPIWFSPASGDKSVSSAPFATVAVAGHHMSGGVYCECDNPNSHLLGLNAQGGDRACNDEDYTQGDSSAELGIAFVALMLWLKLRA